MDSFSLGSYSLSSRTFGTQLRDQAVFLLGAVALDRFDLADRWVASLSSSLASDEWHSTQSTSWALLALSRYVGATQDDESFSLGYRRGDGNVVPLRSERPILRVPLENFLDQGDQGDQGEMVEIENRSKRRLYATLSSRGVPRIGEEVAAANGLRLEVGYEDLSGALLDETRIAQGRDFVATVTVINTRDRPLQNLALTEIVASGWEIHDPRYSGSEESQVAEIDYQNVRDDRVYSYFELDGGERKTFRLLLNAAYRGRFYLPPLAVEAMYDASVHARTVGRWVEVLGAAN